MTQRDDLAHKAREVTDAAEKVIQQARPLVNADNVVHQLRSYVHPACAVLAALHFFRGGQARLSGGKSKSTKQDSSDDGLIPLLSRLGVRFSDSNAAKLIGLLKIALSVGLLYAPTRRPAARWGIGYLLLGLLSRIHQGISPVPLLINMALLAVPGQVVSV